MSELKIGDKLRITKEFDFSLVGPDFEPGWRVGDIVDVVSIDIGGVVVNSPTATKGLEKGILFFGEFEPVENNSSPEA